MSLHEWAPKGKKERTVDGTFDDLQVVIMPFTRVRGARSAVIRAPAQGGDDFYMRHITRAMIRDVPYRKPFSAGDEKDIYRHKSISTKTSQII